MSEDVSRRAFQGESYDAHGNLVESWAEPVLLEGRFLFDPGSSSEPRRAGMERVIVEPTLYGPFDVPFEPRDKAVVRGETYQVEGEVRRWSNGDRRPGAVISLRRVDG